MPRTGRTAPRSLADDLRARPDEQVAALVLARPDLIHPVPRDLAELAQRAGSPASVALALRALDELTLHVVLAAALAPDPVRSSTVVREVATLLTADGLTLEEARERVRDAVQSLRTAALLWGPERALHLVGATRDLVVPADRGPRVAALEPRVAAYARDPETLRAVLAAAPPGARAALDRLLAGPLVGTVVQARRAPIADRSPVDWLLAHRILIPLGEDRAVVPGEVAAILRAAGPDSPPVVASLVPPAPRDPAPDQVRVDSGAVGAVLDMIHAVAELGRLWTEAPPARLRGGALAVRDLTRAARALGVPEDLATLLVEVAWAAGLLAADSHETLTVLPTPGFDAWLADPPAARAAALLLAWRDMPRSTAAAAQGRLPASAHPPAAGAQPVAGSGQRPLAAEGADPRIAGLRREVLSVLCSHPGVWRDDEVLAALRWRAPLRDEPARAEQSRAVLQDLRRLGVLVFGTLTSAGRALLVTDPVRARTQLEQALASHLPPQVNTLVMQADLTAVVPGLPTAPLAELLRQAAEPESTGAASVYRFSAASIRRALDAGRSPADLLAELGRHGQVPQPLAYLIEDVGRRHATLRIGSATTVLSCADPVLLAALLADPGAARLGLFPLAETVLGSALPADQVLEGLRDLGHHPQPMPGRGPDLPRLRRAHARATPVEPLSTPVTPALAAAAVRAMRGLRTDRPDRRATDGPDASGTDPARPPAGRGPSGTHPVPVGTPREVVAALQAAIAAEAPVWIGYADPSGVASDRRVEPLRLAGGYLTALDLRTEAIQSFALARITGVQVP